MTVSPSSVPRTSGDVRTRRRDEILRAAAGLFASDGYTSTSMREVAAASGILPGSLYHHFESKEAIAVELVEEYHADLIQVVREFQPKGAKGTGGAAGARDADGARDAGSARDADDARDADGARDAEDAEGARDAVGARDAGARAADRAEGAGAAADAVAALRAFAHEIANVSFRHQAALQISVFDAPTTASSSLKTVVHAEPASLDRRWRSLITAAAAAGAFKAGVDTRIVRHVLHRTIVQVGLAWECPSGPGAVTDCVLALLFDGLAPSADACADRSKPARIVDDATMRWAEQAAQRRRQRRGQILDAARSEFAQRGFEATTVRDIAEAAELKASNLYRYFESKDSMIQEILGDFSASLLAVYRDVIAAGSSTVETLDAILWLLNQASRHFSREVEILQTYRRLTALGVAERYHEGAQARLELLAELIARGVSAGELSDVAEPFLVASCLREIMWAPMPRLVHISPQRVREFHRQSVLSGMVASAPRPA